MTVQFDETKNYDDMRRCAQIVVVEFIAKWCSACRGMEAVIVEMEKEYDVENLCIKIVQIDVDANLQLAQTFDVVATPTFLFYKHGILEKRIVGAHAAAIKDSVETLITDVSSLQNDPEHSDYNPSRCAGCSGS